MAGYQVPVPMQERTLLHALEILEYPEPIPILLQIDRSQPHQEGTRIAGPFYTGGVSANSRATCFPAHQTIDCKDAHPEGLTNDAVYRVHQESYQTQFIPN